MIDAEIEDRLRDKLPALARLGAIVRFDLGPDGAAVLDATGGRAVIDEKSTAAPDCTISITRENLLKLLDGKLDPLLGYTLGKIRVAGSIGTAMKLIGALD
ncbi:MAG: SCP2 sterol-binding domain-containing protein [Siculibacillus sp.]